MTRKHFEALAAALAASRPAPDAPAVYWRQWYADRDAIANVCEASNKRFDRDRFIFATGY